MSALSNAKKEAEIHFRRRAATALVNIKLVEALIKARDFIAEELESRQDGIIAPDDPPEYLTRPKSVLAEIRAAIQLAQEAGQ